MRHNIRVVESCRTRALEDALEHSTLSAVVLNLLLLSLGLILLLHPLLKCWCFARK